MLTRTTFQPLTKRQRLELLLTELKRERSSFESHWRDLAEFILPKRLQINFGEDARGAKALGSIMDTTATLSVRDLQAGMLTGMASPSRPWFTLASPDPRVRDDEGAKEWLTGVRDDMLRVLAESNFYTTLGMLFGDEAVFATGAMSILEDEEDIIRCYVHPVGSFYLATGADNRVTVFVREYKMTVRQMLDEFGDGNLSAGTLDLVRTRHLDKMLDVYQAIYPNEEEYRAGSRNWKNKRWRECWWEKGDPASNRAVGDKILREGGYDDWPVIAARWETSGSDVYGTMSPGMLALPDIRSLQVGYRKLMNAAEKQVNPPLQIPGDLSRDEVQLGSGGVTEVASTADTSGKAIRQLHEVRLNLADLNAVLVETRHRVEGAFYRDLFRMLIDEERRQPPTAEEIRARQREKLSVLGPVLERHNDDVFEPAIQRVFNIMLRRNLIPPPPPSMAGAELRVQYVSEVALAQKMVGLGSIERHVGFITNLMQFVPAIADTVDWDGVASEHADATSVSPKVTRGADEIADLRAMRQQAERAAATAAAVPGMAKAARDLSETKINGDETALDAIAGGAA